MHTIASTSIDPSAAADGIRAGHVSAAGTAHNSADTDSAPAVSVIGGTSASLRVTMIGATA